MWLPSQRARFRHVHCGTRRSAVKASSPPTGSVDKYLSTYHPLWFRKEQPQDVGSSPVDNFRRLTSRMYYRFNRESCAPGGARLRRNVHRNVHTFPSISATCALGSWTWFFSPMRSAPRTVRDGPSGRAASSAPRGQPSASRHWRGAGGRRERTAAARARATTLHTLLHSALPFP